MEAVETLPGAEHFSGSLNGSVEHGELRAHMAKALMPYAGVFRAPLEIAAGEATLSWVKNDKGFMLDGRDIDVQATGVRARGGFRYLQPQGTIPGWAFWRASAPMTVVRHGVISRKI